MTDAVDPVLGRTHKSFRVDDGHHSPVLNRSIGGRNLKHAAKTGHMVNEVDALLQKAELFREAPSEIRQALARRCRPKQFSRGTVIFHRDSTDRSLYLIANGYVRIYLTGESGREVTLNFCGPGEVVGELSMIDGRPRSASAQAIDDVLMYALHHEDFMEVLQPSPLATAMFQVLCNRIRRATDDTESLALFDVYGRLARRILELATPHGLHLEINLELSQTDLAALVGATRETVNRALAAFRQQGLIEQQGARIVVLQPDLLRRRIQ